MSRVLPPVIVDLALVNRLKKQATCKAKSFAIGKNENNVVVDAVRMKKTGGCDQMPATNPNEIALATIPLWKKGLIPCGYARVRIDVDGKSGFGAYTTYEKYNTFCLQISSGGVAGVTYNSYTGIRNRDWNVIKYTKGGEKKNGK